MKQCFDWETNTLDIETAAGIKFDLKLKGNKTIICGDSATGKTLLCSVIKSYQDSFNDPVLSKYDMSNIILITKQNKHELQSYKSKLMIIDRADLLLNDADVETINNDTDVNKYIIFSRKPLGIYLSPNYYGELITKGDTIGLEYI